MAIRKVELSGSWDLKLPIQILLIYFFLLFPAIHFFLRGHPLITSLGVPAFYAAVLVYLFFVKKISLSHLGLSPKHLKQHLLIGATLGGLVPAFLPVLDGFITMTGLDQSELLSSTIQRPTGIDNGIRAPWTLLGLVVLLPVLKQIFFTGFLVQSLLRKFNPVLAVYGGGLLFTLGHFQFNLGVFAIGSITAILFKHTGTLYAPFLFHMSCSLAGILLAEFYPHLITLFSFLF